MAGSLILMNLAGAVALLLWGIRMVRTGLERAFGRRLSAAMKAMSGNRFTALATGTAFAACLQSSTAVILTAAGFAGRGTIAVMPALAMALGADIGTAIAARVLSLNISAVSPALLFAGVTVFLTTSGKVPRNVGRTLIGLGLIFLALSLIGQSSMAIRQGDGAEVLVAILGSDPLLTALVGALFTVIAHSSLAIMLLVVKLVADGVIGFEVAVALTIGINLAAGLPAVLGAMAEPTAGRRVALGNALFRIVGALVAIWFTGMLAQTMTSWSLDNAGGVLVLHLAFNVALAVVFLPLLTPAQKMLERILPEPSANGDDTEIRPIYLAAADRSQPRRAIANVVREIMRMGETVHEMMADALGAFSDRAMVARIRARDDAVDTLHGAITMYVAEISREHMSESESRQAMAVFAFSTDLEHVGDIIDHNLMSLAQDKHRMGVDFSEEGWRELREMHAALVDNFRLSLDVFMTGDDDLAKQLLEEKARFRNRIHHSIESHVARLRDGLEQSRTTSTMHLDILRDFRRINSHLSSTAYPVLRGD